MPLKPYYEDALTTLYHADIRDIVEQLEQPSSIVTDPPYGIRYCPRETYSTSWAGAPIAGDEDTDLIQWLAARWPSTPMLMFGSYKVPPPFKPNATLVWDKGVACGMGDLSMPWKPNWELIWVRGRTWRGKRTSGVLSHAITPFERRGRMHPTEKPVELLMELVAKAPPGLVLDPCCGSGPTLEAARRLGRRSIGVELVERYAEAAARRLAA